MNNKLFNNSQVGIVSTFDELINKKFQGSMNAICWYRNLDGDFEEIVSKLQLVDNVTDISIDDILFLSLSEKGEIAREIILNDLKFLTNLGALPSLNLIKNYERDEEFDFISTDVYSFHVDRSTLATDTFLCTYYGIAGDILPNNEVEQKILNPQIRQKIKGIYDGLETEFETFLKESFFDLHYQPAPNANPLNLGVGHLWKLAVDHAEQLVLPCVHRAPIESPGEYRLLLIC